jgi:hypothetical protein
MLGRVAPVRTKVSKERIASIIRVTRIGALGTTLAYATRRNIPEDGIIYIRHRENSILQEIKMFPILDLR